MAVGRFISIAVSLPPRRVLPQCRGAVSTTSHVPGIAHYQAYLSLGVVNEAQNAAAVLQVIISPIATGTAMATAFSAT